MFDSSALIAEARRRTGLQNLGEDAFREPLQKLVDSVNRESKFTPFGEQALKDMLVRALTNRLEVEEWYRRHPEIDDEEIVAPLIVLGMPRTGSTLLGSLLAQDPQTRWLRTWEAMSPCPPPIKGEVDERAIAADEYFRIYKEKSPDIYAMIPFGPDEPNEDYELMLNSFCFDYFYVYCHCSSFLEWFYDPARDYSFGYRYHKRVLKLLQWRCPPKRWTLKLPGHSVMIEGLAQVYPDARLAWTHRDPAKVLPSISHLVEIIRAPRLEDARMDEFAEVQTQIWERSMHRLLDYRTRHEHQFIDVYHGELLRNSEQEIERVYRWMGWPFPPELSGAINRWRDAHPRQEISYGAEANRFDAAELQRRFKFYTDRFGTRAATAG
jgi:hypothetical protein